MTNIPQLPGAHAWKDGQGRPLPVEFYRFFRDLALRNDIPADVSAQVASLLSRVDALEAESDAQIHPDSPITIAGTLAGGLVVVGLENKTPAAGGALLVTEFDGKGLRISEAPAVLDDVSDVSAATPSDGDALLWNEGAGAWVAGQASVPQVFNRITADGDIRITADGDLRITD